MDDNKIKYYRKRVDDMLSQLEDMTGKHAKLKAEDRMELYGHPKELVEKLNTACLGVKLTLENVPLIVERLEQKRKLHEMCAQVMLDVKMLERQQQLI